MIKNLSFIFFLHFCVLLDVFTHLAKFQSVMNIRSHFILTFISENLQPPLKNLFHGLVANERKSKAQKYLMG